MNSALSIFSLPNIIAENNKDAMSAFLNTDNFTDPNRTKQSLIVLIQAVLENEFDTESAKYLRDNLSERMPSIKSAVFHAIAHSFCSEKNSKILLFLQEHRDRVFGIEWLERKLLDRQNTDPEISSAVLSKLDEIIATNS